MCTMDYIGSHAKQPCQPGRLDRLVLFVSLVMVVVVTVLLVVQLTRSGPERQPYAPAPTQTSEPHLVLV